MTDLLTSCAQFAVRFQLYLTTALTLILMFKCVYLLKCINRQGEHIAFIYRELMINGLKDLGNTIDEALDKMDQLKDKLEK